MTLAMGVIGLGHWGPNLVRSFAQNPRVTVKAVCDTRDEAFGRIAGLIPNAYDRHSNPDALIADPDIDAVAIVTPASYHADLVKKALRAGKHVFCEKPLAFERATLTEVEALAKQENRALMIGYTFLFNSGIVKLKEIVDDGRLGEIYYVTATRTHMGLVRQDVSVIWDLASHDVAIMNHLLGEKPKVAAVTSGHPLGSPRCDVAFIGLTYSSGIVAQIKVSWVDSNKVRSVDIVGSKARAVFDDLNNLEPVRLYEKGIGVADAVEPDFGAFRYLVNDGDIISPKIRMVEPLKVETEAFIDLLLHGTPNPATPSFAADVSATLDAVSRSAANGGAPVQVD